MIPPLMMAVTHLNRAMDSLKEAKRTEPVARLVLAEDVIKQVISELKQETR